MRAIKVLLSDDHTGFRQLLAPSLRTQEGVEVVGEASDGCEAVEQTEEYHPDLVLMDANMPRRNGFEATRDIKAHSPKTKVIILSMHTGEEYKRLAFQNQADGYIEKDGAVKKLHALVN